MIKTNSVLSTKGRLSGRLARLDKVQAQVDDDIIVHFAVPLTIDLVDHLDAALDVLREHDGGKRRLIARIREIRRDFNAWTQAPPDNNFPVRHFAALQQITEGITTLSSAAREALEALSPRFEVLTRFADKLKEEPPSIGQQVSLFDDLEPLKPRPEVLAESAGELEEEPVSDRFQLSLFDDSEGDGISERAASVDNGMALVVDDAVLDSPANRAYFELLKTLSFGDRGIYLFSEWRIKRATGEDMEQQVGFVLSMGKKNELATLLGMGSSAEISFATRGSAAGLSSFWVIPFYRLSTDLEFLGKLIRLGDGVLPPAWQNYLLQAIRGEVDHRPLEREELEVIEREMLAVLDLIIAA